MPNLNTHPYRQFTVTHAIMGVCANSTVIVNLRSVVLSHGCTICSTMWDFVKHLVQIHMDHIKCANIKRHHILIKFNPVTQIHLSINKSMLTLHICYDSLLLLTNLSDHLLSVTHFICSFLVIFIQYNSSSL